MPCKLHVEIIKLSEASLWPEAQKEWSINHAYREEDGKICLCGRNTIKECYVLRNSITSKCATVGNCCISVLFDRNSTQTKHAQHLKQANSGGRSITKNDFLANPKAFDQICKPSVPQVQNYWHTPTPAPKLLATLSPAARSIHFGASLWPIFQPGSDSKISNIGLSTDKNRKATHQEDSAERQPKKSR
jgi:hypothetical protein